MVRGIPGHPDLGALRDPDSRHAVAQPTEPAADSDDGPHRAHRTRAPVHPPVSHTGFCAITRDLFSIPGRSNTDIFSTGGTGETPAHGSDARVRNTNRQSVHDKDNLSPGIACPTSGYDRNCLRYKRLLRIARAGIGLARILYVWH